MMAIFGSSKGPLVHWLSISLFLVTFTTQTTASFFNDPYNGGYNLYRPRSAFPSAPDDRVKGPLTPHFMTWLKCNGYASFNFDRPDMGPKGSFGGKFDEYHQITKVPIIFIHGNSDGALADGGHDYNSGFSSSIVNFLQQGYTPAELYATTWGDNRDLLQATKKSHECRHLYFIRMFVEAVMRYTNVYKVDIIAHSMGVTIGRRIIRGGNFFINGENCNLGQRLNQNIRAFIGIAGANDGTCLCADPNLLKEPTCDPGIGLYPGDNCGRNNHQQCSADQQVTCQKPNLSWFLRFLNEDPYRVGDLVATIGSQDDEVLFNGGMVYGRRTTFIRNAHYNLMLRNLNLSHTDVKDKTVELQYNLISKGTPS